MSGKAKTDVAREPCTYCKKTIHNPDIKEAGNHAGSSTRLGNNIMEYSYHESGKTVGDHPLSVPPAKGEFPKYKTAQAHHLICCQIMNAKGTKWEQICKNYGYHIDNSHNGIVLPADMRVACHERIPLHRGNHSKTTTEAEGKNYVQGVKNMVQPVYDLAVNEDYCNAESEIISHLNEISKDICYLIITFAWTLTDEGKDFNIGGKGCLGENSIPDKRNSKLIECPQKRDHGIKIGQYFKEQ
jgi:hypothetical protein